MKSNWGENCCIMEFIMISNEKMRNCQTVIQFDSIKDLLKESEYD